MSCRVLKRGVEAALVNHLFEQARLRGLGGVRGAYVKTDRNGLVADFYRDFGFAPIQDEGGDGAQLWQLACAAYRPQAHFITVADA